MRQRKNFIGVASTAEFWLKHDKNSATLPVKAQNAHIFKR